MEGGREGSRLSLNLDVEVTVTSWHNSCTFTGGLFIRLEAAEQVDNQAKGQKVTGSNWPENRFSFSRGMIDLHAVCDPNLQRRHYLNHINISLD